MIASVISLGMYRITVVTSGIIYGLPQRVRLGCRLEGYLPIQLFEGSLFIQFSIAPEDFLERKVPEEIIAKLRMCWAFQEEFEVEA